MTGLYDLSHDMRWYSFRFGCWHYKSLQWWKFKTILQCHFAFSQDRFEPANIDRFHCGVCFESYILFYLPLNITLFLLLSLLSLTSYCHSEWELSTKKCNQKAAMSMVLQQHATLLNRFVNLKRVRLNAVEFMHTAHYSAHGDKYVLYPS